MEYHLESFKSDFNIMENEIAKAIVGQKVAVRNILAAVIAGGNVLLQGLPGLGKTEMVKAVASALNLSFSRIQFTPDLMPQDITGTDILVKDKDGNAGFKFQKGPLFSNIVLADEINRATPKTQSALLEAMQEGTVTSGANTYRLPTPFFVLATQNPLEMEGTYSLPEAQMDRFLIKMDIDFPDENELLEIVNRTASGASTTLNKVFSGEELLNMKSAVVKVPVSKSVMEYAIKIVMMTHPEYAQAPEMVKKYVRYGASPRGAQGIITMAKIYALLDSRFNVAFEDISQAAIPVLNHRLFMNFEALTEGIGSVDILKCVIEEGKRLWKI